MWQNIDTPTQIVDSNVSEVFLSSNHTLFLKDNGLWGMGYNHNGQLGLGEDLRWQNIDTPAQIVDSNVSEVFLASNHTNHTLFLKDNGSLWGMVQPFWTTRTGMIECGKISIPQHKLWIVMSPRFSFPQIIPYSLRTMVP